MPDRKGQVPGQPRPWPAPPPPALPAVERDRRAAAYDKLVEYVRGVGGPVGAALLADLGEPL